MFLSPCILIAILGSPVRQDPDRKLAETLTKGYETALLKQDIKWFEKNCSSDYINITARRRKQRKDVALKNLQASFASIVKLDRMTINVTSVRRDEGGLFVVCDVKLAGAYKGAKGLVEMKQWEEDLWVPKGKIWQLKRSMTMSSTTKVGGRVVG